jgi:hypothetical protein
VPAVYLWTTLADVDDRGALYVGYLDTAGDPSVRGLWATRFGTVGAVAHPLAPLDVVVQWIEGETRTRVNAWNTRFRTVAPLLSVHHGPHRLSARWDWFEVSDTDGPPRSDEHGNASTLAYLLALGLRHRVAVEWIHTDSRHSGLAHADRSDDAWQVSYRFRY